MGKLGKVNIRELKKFQKQLAKLQDSDAFVEACVKDLAARLLAKVIKRTPVGDYSKEIEVTAKRDSKKHKKGDVYTKRVNPSGKRGGTLRRGWISESHEEAKKGKASPKHEEILDYANGLKISHSGTEYKIDIINPVEYASYVEYGHRNKKKNGYGWTQGHFMMTISEKELETIAPKILEAKIKKHLEECMK